MSRLPIWRWNVCLYVLLNHLSFFVHGRQVTRGSIVVEMTLQDVDGGANVTLLVVEMHNDVSSHRYRLLSPCLSSFSAAIVQEQVDHHHLQWAGSRSCWWWFWQLLGWGWRSRWSHSSFVHLCCCHWYSDAGTDSGRGHPGHCELPGTEDVCVYCAMCVCELGVFLARLLFACSAEETSSLTWPPHSPVLSVKMWVTSVKSLGANSSLLSRPSSRWRMICPNQTRPKKQEEAPRTTLTPKLL